MATLLLVATLDHIDAFHGLLGAAWIEVYAAFAPIAVAIVAMQLVAPGRDPARSEHAAAQPVPSAVAANGTHVPAQR